MKDLGLCTRCAAAPATIQDDVISSNRFCKKCWDTYMLEFDALAKTQRTFQIEICEKSEPQEQKKFFWDGDGPSPERTTTPLESMLDSIFPAAERMTKGRKRTADTTWCRPHYFDIGTASPLDIELRMAKDQGYVPEGCLLGGRPVMALVRAGEDPCAGCNGPREVCGGRQKDRCMI